MKNASSGSRIRHRRGQPFELQSIDGISSVLSRSDFVRSAWRLDNHSWPKGPKHAHRRHP